MSTNGKMSGSRRLGRAELLAALLAVAGPGVVTLLAFTDTSELVPALLYVLAIAAAASSGGIWFGVAASVLSLLPFLFFFAPPRHAFAFSHAEDIVAAVVFAVTAVGVGGLIEREKRARLLAEEERARAAEAQRRAEALARTSDRLQRAAEALSVAVAPAQVLDAVLTESVAAADARAGLIALLTPDGKELEIVAQRGYGRLSLEQWGRFPVDAAYPLSEAVRTGEPVFLASADERVARFPTLPRGEEPTHALACMPLTVEGRTIGGLAFSFAADQEFDVTRRATKIALARQAAVALERARLYEALQAAEARMAFLAEAAELLTSSLDYEETLAQVAAVAVPRLADWCTVDVLAEDGEIKRVAVAHADPDKVEWAWELQQRFPPDPEEETGVSNVLRTGEAEFLPEIPQELLDQAVERRPELAEVIERLGLRSWICVPLKTHDRVLGALSLVSADSNRIFGQADLELALAVAERAATAVENSLLYAEAERRADAARALSYVGEAVILVDRDDLVRYWNVAAEHLSGVPEAQALGRPAADVVPGWSALVEHAPPADAAGGELARSSVVPISARGEELWISAAAVDFGEGRVYALRDVTEEHELEQARSDFVATASHELRTPLTAVYGAVRTLRRTDVDIGRANTELFLEIIENETERLNVIVNQILVAGQLESETLRIQPTQCDLHGLAEDVVAAARLRAPDSIELAVEAPPELPPVQVDEDKVRQVLVNLVENAIKYSPDGGPVRVAVNADDGRVTLAVSDRGLGIPPGDQARIFEKFARLDPSLARGVGGTGLGLYIARELTTRMGGLISVDSRRGEGSTFTVELPVGAA